MFNFRIINLEDGNQVIDTRLKTSYESLTPVQLVEYTEMSNQIAYMERLERKRKAESACRRKRARNPFYRLACLCGLV